MSAPHWLLTLIAFALVFLAGTALLHLLLREQTLGTPFLERCGLSWVLGSGYVSVGIFVAGWAINGAALVTLISAGAILLAFVAYGLKIPVRVQWRRLTIFESLIAVVLFGQAVFIVWWTSKLALGWDGIVLWEAKARMAVENGGSLPLRYFSEIPFPWRQPRYPLYLPYTEAWLYLCLGHPHQAWVRIIGPLVYLAALLIVAGATERLGGSRMAGLIAAAAFFFVPYLFSGSWNVLAGYADFPLGVLYLAAASRLPGLTGGVSRTEIRLFAVLAGLVVWGKQEGFYLWLMLMGLSALFLVRTGGWRQVIVVILPGALLAGAFFLFLRFARTPPDPFYLSPTPANVLARVDRVEPMLWRLGRELLNFESWGLLWVGMILAFAALACRRRWHLAIGFGGALCMPLMFFVWPFVLSMSDDYMVHVDHALARLLMQVAPLAILAIAVAVPPLPEFRRTVD